MTKLMSSSSAIQRGSPTGQLAAPLASSSSGTTLAAPRPPPRPPLPPPPPPPPFMTLLSPLRALGRQPRPVFRLLRGFTRMARVPILHGTLVLLRGEAEHRSSTMEAVVLFSEEERRICHVLRPFQAATVAVIPLRAQAVEPPRRNIVRAGG